MASPRVPMALRLLRKPSAIRSFHLESDQIPFHESAHKTKGGQEEFAAGAAIQSCGQ